MAIGTLAAIAIGAGALGSAVISSSASGKAVDASNYAADQSAMETRAARDKAYGTLDPFIKSGTQASSSINALLGLGGDPTKQRQAFDTYRKSTGYDFRLGEGMNALNSGYAGAGTIQSGAAMKDAVRYGQDFASNEFGNYMNALGNQQGVGVQAGGAAAGVGINSANSLAQINDARATGIGNAALSNAQNINSLIGTLGAGILKYG